MWLKSKEFKKILGLSNQALYERRKKGQLKYRVSLDECLHKFNVFQQNSSHKSMVLNYVFYD